MRDSDAEQMNKANGQSRSRVLVTITPYNEQEKRVLNTTPIATNIPAPPVPPPLPVPLATKGRSADDSVEMQSIESFKLKDTPNPVIPKPPPTYFPVTNSTNSTANGSPRHGTLVNKPQENGKTQSNPIVDATKPSVSPTTNGQNVKPLAQGKVAIRIGAYEGEAKQPSKLDFLAQQPRAEKTSTEEMSNAPVVSRLQNELAATLQRSNLRRKTEGENQSNAKTIPENNIPGCGNEATNREPPGKLPQSKVDTLATALNKVTIKVNPDNTSR